jgi:hypothetical protein
MSMEIDFASALTEEERAYLDSRGRYADIQRADGLHGVETPASGEGDGTGLQQAALLTSEARAAEKERLLARLREIDGVDTDETDRDDDGGLPPYEDWKVSDLDGELKARNLSTAGTKSEKADRLYADDESRAALTTPAE